MAKETYTVLKSTDNTFKQHFTDAKEAGKAFSDIAGSEKPSVIKNTPGKGSELLARTAEKRSGSEIHYSKYVEQSDKTFADAWREAERGKTGHQLPDANYRLLENGRQDQEFSSPADAGKAWRDAVSFNDPVMQYREGGGDWKTLASTGFDGNHPYKGMPSPEMPGASEFVAAHDAAMGKSYVRPQLENDGIGF